MFVYEKTIVICTDYKNVTFYLLNKINSYSLGVQSFDFFDLNRIHKTFLLNKNIFQINLLEHTVISIQFNEKMDKLVLVTVDKNNKQDVMLFNVFYDSENGVINLRFISKVGDGSFLFESCAFAYDLKKDEEYLLLKWNCNMLSKIIVNSSEEKYY